MDRSVHRHSMSVSERKIRSQPSDRPRLTGGSSMPPGRTMRTRPEQRMLLVRCLCALTLIALPSDLSFAKGGAFRSEDRYKPQHIDGLPLEIRSAIYRMCSAPKALHPFASFSDDMHRIILHFEHFYCQQRDGFCRQSGACLHEVYESRGHHFQLIRRYFAEPAGERLP